MGMQVTSLLSRHEHEHGPECGCGHDHEHSVTHLWQAVAGVVLVINAYVVDALFTQGGAVASASACPIACTSSCCRNKPGLIS